MKPTDVLALRAELCRWLSSDRGARDELAHYRHLGVGRDTARTFCAEKAAALKASALFYVSADMTTVAREAARTLPSIERVDALDFPAASGLLCFDGIAHRSVFEDAHSGPERHDLRAMQWIGMPGGVRLLFYIDSAEAFAPHPNELAAARAEGPLPRLFELTQSALTFGEGGVEHVQVNRETSQVEHVEDNWTAPMLRVMFATFQLMRQNLVVTERAHVPRHIARRCIREDVTADVLVVRLRHLRTSGDSEVGDGGVEWTHRWIVGGHWRQQWLPSRGVHRPTWIAPYVKGPENLPLIVKERIEALVR